MDHLLTEKRHDASTHIDVMSAREIVHLMNAADATVAAAVATQAEAIAQAIDIIAERLRRGGRLLYLGAGTSGRLGVLDASECPPTFNSPPAQVVGIIAGGERALTSSVEGAEDQPHAAVDDLRARQLSAHDVLVGIATSGRTPYVIGGLRYARQCQAYAIGLACVPDPELAADADLLITPLVGPEILTGSTRLKAGTATKQVLNMLSTGAMVRLGKVYGNLMVDLRATNTKLQARTNRIIRQLVGGDEASAASLLAACSGELKTAIVAGKAKLSPDAARARLIAANGVVHAALHESLQPATYPACALGIDGGGTQTTAILLNATGLLGRGTAGPANSKTVGRAAAHAAIKQAILAAFQAANLPPGRVGGMVMGLAGAGRRSDQAAWEAWANSELLAQQVRVVGDVELPLEMLPERWGVSVVAGTGACVFARTADGRTARAGGWGPWLGDGGSAYDMVLAAFRLITREADHLDHAGLLRTNLLHAMQLQEPHELIGALHGGAWDRARLAGLAPVVIQTADHGDSAAQHIIIEQAQALASNVAAVVRWLAIEPLTVPLALTGGLLLHVPRYQRMMLDAMAGKGIRPRVVVPVPHAAEMAARWALAELPT